eukprot:IDg14492t1
MGRSSLRSSNTGILLVLNKIAFLPALHSLRHHHQAPPPPLRYFANLSISRHHMSDEYFLIIACSSRLASTDLTAFPCRMPRRARIRLHIPRRATHRRHPGSDHRSCAACTRRAICAALRCVCSNEMELPPTVSAV